MALYGFSRCRRLAFLRYESTRDKLDRTLDLDLSSYRVHLRIAFVGTKVTVTNEFDPWFPILGFANSFLEPTILFAGAAAILPDNRAGDLHLRDDPADTASER